MTNFTYDIALSFAGEDRMFAKGLAFALEDANYEVFYDEFKTAELWGTDLTTSLGDIYSKLSHYCIMIISKPYAANVWTNHERRFAIQRALATNVDYILPIRLDGTELPGWPSTIAYLDATKWQLRDIVRIIFEKVGQPVAISQIKISAEDQKLGNSLLKVCFRRALFTRMKAEISVTAMAGSLRSILYEIQPIVGSFIDPQLQSIGIQIISLLDEIDRDLDKIDRNAPRNQKYLLFQIGDSELHHLDYLKLEILTLLKQIKRITGSSLQFGLSLYSDHFSSADEGTEAPHFSYEPQVEARLRRGERPVLARDFGERIMQEELTKINQAPTRSLSGISPLGNACMLALDISSGSNFSVSWQELADLIEKRVRDGQSDGANGSELVFSNPSKIVSGRTIKLVICRPLIGNELFAIEYEQGYWRHDTYYDKFLDEHKIDYFKTFYKKFEKSSAISHEVSVIRGLAVKDEIELNEYLRIHGWRDLRE